jgi:hypothetical protein
MKKLFFIITCLIASILNAQTNKFSNNKTEIVKVFEEKYSNRQVEQFIREVFLNHADDLVLKNEASRRLALIKDFLNNRFEIQYKPEYSGKKFNLLSTVSLSNKYNPNLKRDYSVVDKYSFNPLKYNFLMGSKNKMSYRIDNTDYIITIFPSK